MRHFGRQLRALFDSFASHPVYLTFKAKRSCAEVQPCQMSLQMTETSLPGSIESLKEIEIGFGLKRIVPGGCHLGFSLSPLKIATALKGASAFNSISSYSSSASDK